MKRKFRQHAIVDERGILRLPDLLVEDLATNLINRNVIVTVEDAAGSRSPNQNSYYHAAIVAPICRRFNELGERFDINDVHEILKFKFLRQFKVDPETAETMFEFVRSTTSLKVYEFSLFIDDCIRYAAEDLALSIDPPHRRRNEFIFPMFCELDEPFEQYVERVSSYVDDIFSIDHLVRYFNQNPEWSSDPIIKQIFTKRKKVLES